MHKTTASCSAPGCERPATRKLAATWSYDRFQELKTYGYACDEHINDVTRMAEKRPRPRHLAPGESIGAVASYPISS